MTVYVVWCVCAGAIHWNRDQIIYPGICRACAFDFMGRWEHLQIWRGLRHPPEENEDHLHLQGRDLGLAASPWDKTAYWGCWKRPDVHNDLLKCGHVVVHFQNTLGAEMGHLLLALPHSPTTKLPDVKAGPSLNVWHQDPSQTCHISSSTIKRHADQ